MLEIPDLDDALLLELFVLPSRASHRKSRLIAIWFPISWGWKPVSATGVAPGSSRSSSDGGIGRRGSSRPKVSNLRPRGRINRPTRDSHGP